MPALVVGAARGIGRAIAARFVAEGARVVVADTGVALGPAVIEALGGTSVARLVCAAVYATTTLSTGELPAVPGFMSARIGKSLLDALLRYSTFGSPSFV